MPLKEWEDSNPLFKLPGIERIATLVEKTWDKWMTLLSRTALRFFRQDRNQEDFSLLTASWFFLMEKGI